MNDLRRKSLRAVNEKLSVILDELLSIENAEQDYRDGIPAPLQSGKRYERVDAVCDVLHDAVGCVDKAIMSIREAVR